MKRLLMKWFPNYFTVNNHVTTWLNVDKLEPSDALKVFEVNPEDNSLTAGLGITEERAMEIAKAIEVQFIKCNNIVEVMANLTAETVKHPNESFFAAVQIAGKMRSRNEPDLGGFLEFLRRKGGQ